MKKKICSFFMLAFLAVFVISCSQSEDLLSAEENVQTRADSPFLLVTPTGVDFENIALYDIATDTVNIKTAGLTSLSVLTNFDVTIQGPDQSKFFVDELEFSLSGLLQALLGGGVNIPVSFQSYEEGTFEAELLITASLLGMLMPVQITVPLYANTAEIPVPTLLYSIPRDGGTVEWDASVPGSEAVGKGQYHLDFVFDKDITIRSAKEILLVYLSTARIMSREVINGNTLRVTLWEDATILPNTLLIRANAITTPQGTLAGVGNEPITLNFSVTGELPDNYIE